MKRRLAIALLVLSGSWLVALAYCGGNSPLSYVRLAMAGYPASPSFYANERAIGRFWVTDPTYGAIGDDSHDDTAAIVAADNAARIALGTTVFPVPPNAYKVTAPISTQWASRWRCEGGSNSQQCVIRAHASMHHVLQLQPGYGVAGVGAEPEGAAAGRGTYERFTVDCNGLAQNGVLFNVTQNSQVHGVNATNCTYAGFRFVNTQLAATLSAVTVTNPGGSPAGETVSQPDPNYSEIQFSPSATFVVKVNTTAARDSSTYVLSINGGSSYSTIALPLAAHVNLAGTDANGAQNLIGFTMAFPSGTYHAGDIFAEAITWTPAIYSDVGSPNSDLDIGEGQLYHDGSVYWSSGFNGDYAGGYSGGLESGTAATAAGSQIVTFTGAPDLTTLFGTGFSRIELKLNASSPLVYKGFVLDASHIAVVHGIEPASTASGLDYAIAVGGGIYEDGLNEGGWNHFHDMIFGLDSVCASFATGNGPDGHDLNLISCGVTGISVGGGVGDPSSSTILRHVHGNSAAAVNGGAVYSLSPYSTGRIEEPQTLRTIAGSGAGGWLLRSAGTDSPISPGGATSWVPFSQLQIHNSTLSITSSGQTIPVPDPTSLTGLGHTSFVQFTMSGSFEMTSAPVIATAPTGTVLLLQNVSTGDEVMTIRSNQFASSGVTMPGVTETIAPGEIATLISTFGSDYPNWTWLGKQQAYGFGLGIPNGNQGTGSGAPVVTTTNTPTHLYQFAVQSGSGLAPNGTFVSCDISASDGTDFAEFSGCRAGWTNSGTRIMANCAAQTGSGAGGVPPFSWAIQFDGNVAGSAFLSAVGDNGHTVTWNDRCQHMDPGQ